MAGGVGLFSKIFSISSMTSGVSFGSTCIALQFSISCSGLVALSINVSIFSYN